MNAFLGSFALAAVLPIGKSCSSARPSARGSQLLRGKAERSEIRRTLSKAASEYDAQTLFFCSPVSSDAYQRVVSRPEAGNVPASVYGGLSFNAVDCEVHVALQMSSCIVCRKAAFRIGWMSRRDEIERLARVKLGWTWTQLQEIEQSRDVLMVLRCCETSAGRGLMTGCGHRQTPRRVQECQGCGMWSDAPLHEGVETWRHVCSMVCTGVAVRGHRGSNETHMDPFRKISESPYESFMILITKFLILSI